jgi:signal transduction histidine kinase
MTTPNRRVFPFGVSALFVGGLVLVAANALSLWANLRAVDRATEWSAHSWSVIAKLSDIKSGALAAEVAQRAYFLTRDDAESKAVLSAKSDVNNACEDLRSLLSGRGAHAEGLHELCALADSRFEQIITRMTKSGRGDDQQALALAKGSAGGIETIQFGDLVAQMLERERLLHEQRVIDLARAHRRADLLSATISLLTLITLCISFSLIRRNVQRREAAERALLDVNARLEETIQLRTTQLSQLSGRLLNIAEKEKLDLANELHDELGSNLTAINLDVASVAERLRETEPALATSLQRALGTLKDTVELKRKIIHGLRPSMLDTLGLAPAITALCADYTQRTGHPCNIDIPTNLAGLDSQWPIALYRIAQECLTNIAKHAQADNVNIAIIRESVGIRMRIIDDGVGIDLEAIHKPFSHGLRSMRERVRQCGGVFAIRPNDNGSGTIVEAVLPFPSAAPGP